MRSPLAALALAALGLVAGPPALAGAPLSEAEVRAFMTHLEHAAQARDVDRLAAALAPDCRISLHTTLEGRAHLTELGRDEYVARLKDGFAAIHDLEQYDYAVDGQTIALSADSTSAQVVSEVTETFVLGGQHLATHSVETARVERRGQQLVLVAVTAVTSAQ